MAIVVPVGTGTSVGTGVTTYSGLLASVGTWLNRSDLTTKIPDFITLLEARLNRELRVPDMEATTTLTASTGTVAFPTDFLEAIHLYVDATCDNEVVPKPLSDFQRSNPANVAGRPFYYAVSGSNILLSPGPDSTYSLILNYYQKLNPLSADNETNWLIVSNPDVYLFGALLMAEAFIWDDPRLPLWKQSWDEAIGSLQKAATKKRYGGGPLFPRPTSSA
jgi:hypothetical protein